MITEQTNDTPDLKGQSFIKAAVLLTIAVFLISAPAPDARVVEDMTNNLIVMAKNPVMEP